MFVSSMTRDDVGRLLAEGNSLSDIARVLGLATNTVAYHRDRLAEEQPTTPQRTIVPPNAVSQVRTRHEVAVLLAEGLSRIDIARRLGVSKATVSYHARRLGAPVDTRCARRYDWPAIQRYYDAGHSVRECSTAFGFSSQTWHAAVNRGAVVARPRATPIEQLLTKGRRRSRHSLKLRLLGAGLKTNTCERCGLTEWRGEPLSMCLHHINGDRDDNRLENLEFLCGNCHGQTDNFSGRNKRRQRAEPSEPDAA
jgi:DNA-binding CsgD family transcriptional regulator